MTYSDQLAHRHQLRTGDGVIIAKSNIGWIQHFGIYLGVNALGHAMIAENYIGRGVRIIPLDQFLNNSEPTRIERYKGDYWQQQQVVQRANERVGRKYNAVLYNCEHFANDVRYGRVESRQVRIAIGVVLAVLFLVFVLPKLAKRLR